MAKYLISFPSVAMAVPDGELEAVGRDAHAVIEEAKAAGVYVFVSMKASHRYSSRLMDRWRKAAIHGRHRLTAASLCLNCHRARTPLRGLHALPRPAGARKSFASSGSILGPDLSIGISMQGRFSSHCLPSLFQQSQKQLRCSRAPRLFG
jgi:hypothetical protein